MSKKDMKKFEYIEDEIQDDENVETNVMSVKDDEIEQILYECCSDILHDVTEYTIDNSLPIAEKLSYSDLFDFICEV